MKAFLDLKKAFDKVDSKKLIDTFCKYDIKRKEENSSSQQFCSVNGHRSKTEEVLCGIPHWSFLGRLFFIVYHNDFEGCLDFCMRNLNLDLVIRLSLSLSMKG